MADEKIVLPVSEELRKDEKLSAFAGRFKSVDELVKSGYEAQQEIGRRLPVPAEDWDDAKWEAFNSKLRPKDKKAYIIEVPEDVKQYFSQARIDQVIEAAHKEGIPARYVNKIAKIDIESAADEARAILKKQADDLKAVELEAERIKAEDDKAFSESCIKNNVKVEEALEFSKRGWNKMAEMINCKPEDLTKLMDTLGVSTHSIFRNIGLKLGEAFADAAPDGAGGESKGKEQEEEKPKVTIVDQLPETSKALGWTNPEQK